MKARIMYKTVNQLAPQRLCDIFQNSNSINEYNLRGSSAKLFIPRPRTEFLKKSFSYWGSDMESDTERDIKDLTSYDSFCEKLSSSTFIFRN